VSTTPVTIRNFNDTYVVQGVPAANYCDRTAILCTAAGVGSEVQGLIWCARPFPLGAQIVSAVLRLYQVHTEAGSHTVKLQKITTLSWIINQVNWNNKPTSTATGEVSVTLGAGAAGREWAWDVTAQMQSVADGGTWSGWKIVSTTDEDLWFHSSQAVALKPVLEVEWSDNPNAPTTLSPAGNRAVSLAKPVVRCDFTDVGGNTLLQAIQVQIDAANNFVSGIDFDSGTVTTSVPELDLNTTAYAGLSSGSSTWWRVRVQDSAGLWSDWSASAQFQRQTKGTLSITNPSAGIIEEPTPPIIWSLSGRTQKAWQLFITPSSDNTVIIHNTGKRTNADTSYTLPAGVIQDDNEYRVHLRVWDTIDREGTPADQAYTYTSQTFEYDYDGTVSPVTSLVATDQSPEPKVLLTWSRSSTPDSFALRRNGVIVAVLDPADVTTGGTSYAYTDRGVPPRTPITWRVDAVVGGATSATNPTVTKTLQTMGIWLTDTRNGSSVQVLTDNPGEWTMGETSAVYTPVGASKSIVITQSLRGYEGTITGRIHPRTGATIAQQQAILWRIKESPGQDFLLTLSDMALVVVVSNLVPAPLDSPDADKEVSFRFHQNANLQFRPIT
jgi:hypothetical protein